MLVYWGRSLASVAFGACGGSALVAWRALFCREGVFSMICLSASLTICSKVGELLFPSRPFELLFFLLSNYLYIYFEIIVSGCHSWNSLTSCPFQLRQP